jgi:betaine-aldehyde dehydrogenase
VLQRRAAGEHCADRTASTWREPVGVARCAVHGSRAGAVRVDDHLPIVSELPHGGAGASGFGKDISSCSLEEYTVVKHVMSDLTGVARKRRHPTVFAGPPL